MLNLYRRHQSPCRFTTRRYRNCKCPIWVQGSLRGEYIRRSLDLRSWEAATDLARNWEGAARLVSSRSQISRASPTRSPVSLRKHSGC